MPQNVQYFIGKLNLYNGQLYDTQRIAILQRLRAKWPTRFDLKKTDQALLDVAEWIKPVILGFPSEKNLLPHEMEDRLAVYTEWAFRLNDWSRDEMRKSARLSDLAGVDKHELEEDTIVTGADPAQDSGRQDSAQGSTQAMAGNTHSSSAPDSTSASVTAFSRAFAWDDVELAVDATVLGLGLIWLPLIQLKPVKSETCHWSDFTFAKFISSLEAETGTKINTGTVQFVYRDIKFSNPGAWNIVLKRFGESVSGQENILRLTVQIKKQLPSTIETGEQDVEVKPMH